jgi:mono/diheme cytochrome c family protein
MACGFLVMGGAEWVREDLRKPWVIGDYMYVNGVRAAPAAPDDAFAIDRVRQRGILETALWARNVPNSGDAVADDVSRGREVFRLTCSACHTEDGYLGMRPLVRGVSAAAAHRTIGRLDGWRHRRMPPFAGNEAEQRALAAYLATLGGASIEALRTSAAGAAIGARLFDENCSVCHGADTEHPFDAKGRSADELYELLARLPSVNDAMPPFEGTDAERRALAEHLVTIAPARGGPGGVR